MNTMKGLLIKDWKLIKKQKMFILMMAAVCVIMLLFYDDVVYTVIYITALFSYLGVGLLSYDEADNGMAYLFTLPITRKQYIIERYVFGFLVIFVPWAVGLAAAFIAGSMKGTVFSMAEFALGSVGALMASWLLFGLVMPLQLKLGPEKSRIAVVLGCMLIAVAIYLLAAVKDAIKKEGGITLTNPADIPAGAVMLAVVLIVSLLMFLSFRLSLNIVEKKEF